MRRVLLALTLLTACEDPLPPFPDGGFQLGCFQPPDGGVFTSGLSAPAPGCALPAPDSGVFALTSLDPRQGGVLVVPPMAAGTPLPVVLAFHGAYGTGRAARGYFGLEDPADGGAIFVYPSAAQGTWDIRPDSLDGRRLDTLLRRLSESYCIDPHRIYIAGFSAGAVYTLWLGCNVPGTFRGLAAVAGTDSRFNTSCCTGSISGMFIHGTADEAIPFAGGRNSRNNLVVRDQCSASTTPDGAHCEASTCSAPLAIDFCQWTGGHDVPDWAGSEIWRFFDELR